MAQIYQYRQQSELTEEETRQAFAPRHRKEWDPQWGGKCPHESIPDPGYKERFKPSLIDRLTPYILIIGFIGFCYFCVWIGYILMGVAD